MFIWCYDTYYDMTDTFIYIYIIIELYFIVLHFINKSAFIILLETADSLKYFYIIISICIIY
jgi:hypothetical protein